jgi:hypothetical protein
MLRYESLLETPETALRDACRQLQLAWDPAMLDWPKADSEIADASNGNASFWKTRGKNLADTLAQYQPRRESRAIADVDLSWLGDALDEFNRACGYPACESPAAASAATPAEATPSFECTRRHRWESYRPRLQRLLSLLGVRERKPLDFPED